MNRRAPDIRPRADDTIGGAWFVSEPDLESDTATMFVPGWGEELKDTNVLAAQYAEDNPECAVVVVGQPRFAAPRNPLEIPAYLREVSPGKLRDKRGKYLLALAQEVRSATGAEHVAVVAHSMGVIDTVTAILHEDDDAITSLTALAPAGFVPQQNVANTITHAYKALCDEITVDGDHAAFRYPVQLAAEALYAFSHIEEDLLEIGSSSDVTLYGIDFADDRLFPRTRMLTEFQDGYAVYADDGRVCHNASTHRRYAPGLSRLMRSLHANDAT